MSPSRIRVLVVDDSAFARKVIREVLGKSAQIEVVGIARDGLEALEKVGELRPDVLTLDLVMPNLDGVGVLKALRAGDVHPRVVVVSMSGSDSALGIEALHEGAIDVVQKPTALATDRLYELGGELIAKVIAAAGARPPSMTPAAARPVPVPAAGKTALVVIGTSTGGPQALSRLLTALPAAFPVPIAIALHIPEGYTEGLARRLTQTSQLQVREAASGMPLGSGQVLLAPGGSNLSIVRRGDGLVAAVEAPALNALHVPSVDRLFASAAALNAGRVLGVVLTGMGNDGLAGARQIHAAGGALLTESETSCVVYGMPRCVDEAGLSTASVPLEQMAAAIVSNL